jgi:hypothetical protein
VHATATVTALVGWDESHSWNVIVPPSGTITEDALVRMAELEIAQPAGHVVFAAALPDREGARVADAHVARVQAQHDLAEGDFVEPATAGRLECQ